MSSVNVDYKKREEFLKKSLDEFLSQYMGEDVPENERIISYELSGLGLTSQYDDEILKYYLSFKVDPYSKENTIWENTTKDNMCFINFKTTDEGYELERISLIPEHYEEFMEEFEKYKANLSEENTEIQTVQAESQENYLTNQEIETMSNGIFIGFAIILFISFYWIVKMIKK